MENFLMWSHPVFQFSGLALGIYALWQGWLRVKMTIFRKKVIFPWKSHVRLGSLAMILWLIGGLGFYTTHSIFGQTHITEIHARLAWVIFALCVFGLINGAIMDKYKKKRKWLPIAHGAANLVLVVLAVFECCNGVEVWEMFR